MIGSIVETNGKKGKGVAVIQGQKKKEKKESPMQKVKRVALVLFLAVLGWTNQAGAIEVYGPVSGTWRLADSPVKIIGDIYVAKLTINPGVKVVFEGAYNITVDGIIKANGTQAFPIVFRPSAENTAGWENIYFEDAILGSYFKWCVFEGATQSAIRNVRTNVPLENCLFINNSTAEYGGAIRAVIGTQDLVIKGCSFIRNHANYDGGAIYVTGPTGTGEAALSITDSLFSENNAGRYDYNRNTQGGAVWVQGNSKILRSAFFKNETRAYTIYARSGIYSVGGALFTDKGLTEITASSFRKNACRMAAHGYTPDPSYDYGGAVFHNSGILLVQNCLMDSNTIVGGRWPTYRGSAIFVNTGFCSIVNSTLADNTNHSAIHNASGTVAVVNSILFGNYNSGVQISGAAEVTYSDVQLGVAGEGNINYNPIFDYRYRIVSPSPAIDVGNPDPQYNDSSRPPGLGGIRNDMGLTGGPQNLNWIGLDCYRDSDGDTFGDSNGYLFSKSCQLGLVVNSADCNDQNPSINPNVQEEPEEGLCTDKLDNDCDGKVDLLDPGCQCQDAGDCDDGKLCTDDSCESGVCKHVNNTAPCDDGNACTMNDTCAAGTCKGAPLDSDHDTFVSAACGGNDCDDSDSDINPKSLEICDDIDNNCKNGVDEEPLASASCSNQQFCDGSEVCEAGECLAGDPPECDDQVGCTTDSCNEATNKCDHLPNNAVCSNNIFCDGQEVCNPVSGCPKVGPGDPCTPPLLCDEDLDACVGCLDHPDCDDGFYCNGDETCLDGICEDGVAVNCSDGIACTTDTCDESTDTCKHAPNSALCDDNLYCNGRETCTLQGCKAGTAVNCADPNGCTDDYCDEAVDSCEHDCNAEGPADACCNNQVCKGDSICVGCLDNDEDGYGNPANSLCPHPQKDCNDGNANVNPGKAEGSQTTCSDGLDNDCDSKVDGNDTGCQAPPPANQSVGGNEESCGCAVYGPVKSLQYPVTGFIYLLPGVFIYAIRRKYKKALTK